MKAIEKVSACSCGKVVAFILGALALIFSLLIIAGSFFEESADARFGMRIFAIAYPFLMALIGFIFGCFQAFIYNIAAKFVGGIKVKISE